MRGLYILRSLRENMKHLLSTVHPLVLFQSIELNPPHNISFLVLNKTKRGPFLSHKEWNTEADRPSRVPLNSNLANIYSFPSDSYIWVISSSMLSPLSINIDSGMNFYFICYIFSYSLIRLFLISSLRIGLSKKILEFI